MLPLANRLKKKKEIDRAFARGSGRKYGLLFCKTAPNDVNAARFCFVVSKKVSNKAVVRNRLKRRLREAVGRLRPRAISGKDVVLIACPGLEQKDYRQIKETVEKVLRLSGVLVGY